MQQIIKNSEDINNLTNNQIMGTIPKMENSVIKFNGENNIFFCEDNVFLKNANIIFAGNDSLIYLSKNRHPYIMDISTHNDNVFYMGTHNYINDAYGKFVVIMSEQKHCFIGDYGIFSFGISIRNADPHLIYDCDTLNRINQSKSIFIGDHVWIGQNSLILKGSQIDSGCIIGANSVIANKKIPHNTTWAGNPCVQIRDGIFWDKACVHGWTEDNRTQDSLNYSGYVEKYMPGCSPDYWIYAPDESSIVFDEIDEKLATKGSSEKLKVILNLNHKKTKNRFAH